MKFDEIEIGMKAELKHQVTQKDISDFVSLTGDDNKLHTDAYYSAKTSFFKPVAHGMLGASFISTIIGTKIPGDGALWFSQSLDFLLPVRVGDTINVCAEVLTKNEREQTVELLTQIYNQHKQLVTDGKARVKVVAQTANKSEEVDPITTRNVALVIGGSGGIGAESCIALGRAGFDVAVAFSKNEQRAQEVQEEILALGVQAMIVQCDVIDECSVLAMVDSVVRNFGTITAVVNCATTKIAAIKFANLDWDDFKAHIDNQIKGAFNLAKAVLPIMGKNNYGKMVFFNSQELDTPSPNLLPYITGKGALNGFVKSLAFEFAASGIRVNSISPGMTMTEQVSDIPERVRLSFAAKTPLSRIAVPQDIAKTVVFLSSDSSDFLCGETIRVNGGSVMM